MSHNNNNTTETNTQQAGDQSVAIKSIDDIRSLFIGSKLTVPIAKTILTSVFKDEARILFLVFLNSIDLHSTAKTSFLAASFDLKAYDYAKTLLNTNKFTFVEILKCLKIMDSKRVIKKLQEKINNIKEKNEKRKEKLDKGTDEYVNSKYSELSEQEKVDFSTKLKKFNAIFPVNVVTTATTATTTTTKKTNKKSRKPFRNTKSAVKVKEEIEEIKEITENNNENNNNNNNNQDKKGKVQLSEEKSKVVQEKRKKEAGITLKLKKSIAFLESKIKELEVHQYQSSLSGNLKRIFQKWFATVDKQTLEYFALGQPKETWVKLAEILHLGKRDFPQMPWFLGYMFGDKAPEGSIVADLEGSEQKSDEELIRLWELHRPPYSFIRKSMGEKKLSDQLKLAIAKYESLNTVIWWLHEFNTDAIAKLIAQRLASGETISQIALGTLIEKALLNSSLDKELYQTLLNTTMDKLEGIKGRFALPPPISIFSDKSGSMDVAIRLAIIISYLITNITPESSLSFFDTQDHPTKIKPNSIDDIFELNKTVKASGGTTPAASILPLLEDKISKKYLVLVTDEEENGECAGKSFTDLYKEYLKTVNNECKVIFVSFLSNNAKGQMVSEIKRKLNIDPLQFVLDRSKPDVTKIDAMLSVLSAESDQFKVQFELLMKFNQLFGEKLFLKYVSSKKSKLLTYALNVEIVMDILSHLYKYYKDEFNPSELKEFKYFIENVNDKNNCLNLINSFNNELLIHSNAASAAKTKTEIQ